MRKPICLFLLCLSAYCCTAQGYKISVQSNFKKGISYLAYHSGKNYNVEDSAAVSSTGLAVFKSAKKLPPGVYAVVFPGKQLLFDFLVEREQIITIKADTNNLSKAVVAGSPANDLFRQYESFVAVKGTQLQKEKEAYRKSLTRADSLLHETAYNKYNAELNEYRENLVRTKPASMMATLLQAMKDPATPKKNPVTREDSIAGYNFYKEHYWDGISFMDDRIIRTPFFLPKLERYYREVMPQASDSLIRDIDYKLLLARNSPEMFKYLMNWFTDEYINPKYMGQDAVFVHLFNQYHSKGMTGWLNEKQMETVSRRAYMQMANLIGEPAAPLEFLNTSDAVAPLYNINADYTVVLFWDPSCGHCKEELPRIDSIYRASWKDKNVKIYAVLSEENKAEWLKYISANHLDEWTHVYQSAEMKKAEAGSQRPGFRQLYDVTMTPTLYLLDKDKRIIGKKLNFQQLNDLLEVKRAIKK